ncbi:MAG: dihydrodipicolinate reductase [Allobaculum sp.]
MERKVTFVQYGCGKMGKYLMRYGLEKGGELVGAFDVNPAVIGKDVAEIIDHNYEDLGIKVQPASEVDAFFKEHPVDVCIIATRSTVAELEEIMTICANNGVNAITTCEEALYPWNSSPALTHKLDELAKKGNCTLTGVGYCDLYWGTMVTNFMGSQASITKITGSSWYNVEDYGIALAEGHGAGLTPEEFDKTIGAYNDYSSEDLKKVVESGEYVPSYMWNQNGWLCSKLGLHITSQTQKCLPTITDHDIYSSTLGVTVPAGNVTGMRAIVTTTTEEGITFETECVGKIFDEDEFDKNEWTLHGEPESTLVCNKPATVELTCGTIINRIPQLIDAPAGYVTTDQYPYNIYCINPLNTYVTSK